MTALVELRGVVKEFPGARRGDPVHRAVDGVDLSVEKGEIFAIIGYSGAGKSTLVRLVNALEPVTSGSVVIDGVDVTTLSERALRELRLGIGMVFQQFNLMESRTVWGNLAFPLTVAGVGRAEQQQRISELLHFVGLADKAHAHVTDLSGGQKQRVGIARALATNPHVLLADEATSALDPETTRDVLDLLAKVNRELGITIVLITHEMDAVRRIAHRVAVMEKGRIVETGPVLDVFADPEHAVTRRFVGTVIDDLPDATVTAALREHHPGRLVRLAFRTTSIRQSEAFAAFLRRDVGFELVYGGIEEIQGSSFGNLTLALTGEDAAIDAALAEIEPTVAWTEVD
ncbi:methionine ABC transporter ATP-binding protein [Nocardioides sp. Root190]|uniref:methionine ABC transporter ATP-binding protein n=1 Tax=Nocardioides sp. Root190 TaxID=1736488 RepID=UPI0006F6A034|nr:methionine ABC transporter ATP-binding protein [Nocardioides sp. Root190]KRB80145.1 methionine ABC transporter ATP-binding protein [Nocardioides sp. Root190]